MNGRWLSIPRSRWSLRTRVIAATVFVAFAPLLLVFAWSQVDRPASARLWRRVVEARDEAEKAEVAALPALAERHGVWIRIVGEDGTLLVDANADRGREPLDRLERFFLGAPPAQSLAEVDAMRGSLDDRGWLPETRAEGHTVDCDYDYTLLFCEARAVVRPGTYLVVTKSSSRGVAEVYGLRHRLLRLALLTSPLALVVAWLTARRVVRPIEALKRQALARMRERSTARREETRDEAHDLATALDDLLSELERRKLDHERFVADLVHELKSPVAAVRAAAEALGTQAPDERTSRLLRAVDASGRRLEEIVARFLDLSRAEAGFPDEAREELDVGALVAECVEEASADPRREGIVLAASCEDGLRVRGIEPRLCAMVHELVDNAASFVAAGGRVAVSARRDGARIVVSVEDDGPGIAPADVERVFDRYFTTRGHARGTGLGLPLVRAVAEAHGGEAWAESREAGAVLSVALPAA